MAHVATVTIQASQILTDITDFRVFVRLADLPSSFWNVVQDGGGDIRAYKSDGTTQIPREVVFCDTANEEGVLWMRYDGVLSSTANTDIQIHADGSSSEPASDSTYGSENVWSLLTNGSYQAVMHGQDLTTESSSGNAPFTTGSVSVSSAGRESGMNAISIDSSTGSLAVSKAAGDINGCLSAWVNPALDGAFSTIISIADASETDEQINIRTNADNQFQMVFANGGTFTFVADSNTAPSSWSLVHLDIPSATDKRLYLNGVQVATSSLAWNPAGVDRMRVGRSADSTPIGNSTGDLISDAKFRIGSLTNSERLAEVSNQATPLTFYSVSAVGPPTGGNSPSPLQILSSQFSPISATMINGVLQ